MYMIRVRSQSTTDVFIIEYINETRKQKKKPNGDKNTQIIREYWKKP